MSNCKMSFICGGDKRPVVRYEQACDTGKARSLHVVLRRAIQKGVLLESVLCEIIVISCDQTSVKKKEDIYSEVRKIIKHAP